MPAPQASVLESLVKQLITAESVEVPQDYIGDTTLEYNLDFDEYQPAIPKGTNIFSCPGVNAITVEACDTVSDQWIDFISEMSKSICNVWGNWQKAAMFSGLLINATVGMAMPGSLSSTIMMNQAAILAGLNSSEMGEYFIPTAKAIASAFETCWSAWEKGYQVQLQYPTFAAVPMPMAPPTPNIPLPIATGSSVGDPLINKDIMSGMMMSNLSGFSPDNMTKLLFDKFSEGLCQVFDQWKASTMIQNVMGQGPVPSFAPPFSPVGPVVGGTNIPAPGCLV